MSDHTIVVIWVIKVFFVWFFCVFLPSLLNIFCFCKVHTTSVLYYTHLCIKCIASIIFRSQTQAQTQKFPRFTINSTSFVFPNPFSQMKETISVDSILLQFWIFQLTRILVKPQMVCIWGPGVDREPKCQDSSGEILRFDHGPFEWAPNQPPSLPCTLCWLFLVPPGRPISFPCHTWLLSANLPLYPPSPRKGWRCSLRLSQAIPPAYAAMAFFYPFVLPVRLEIGLTNQSILKETTLNPHWKDWIWSWSSNTLATWREQLTHWKRPWCWESFRARRGEGDRGWDGWMASSTQWTRTWANSRR